MYKKLGITNTYFHFLNFPGTAVLDFMMSILIFLGCSYCQEVNEAENLLC